MQPDLSSVPILVVDSDAAMRHSTAYLLRVGGFKQVSTAISAEDCMAQLQQNRVDLVISELALSGADGLALLQFIRKSKQFQHLPFMLVTGQLDRGRIAQAMRLGLNDVLVKPFASGNLLDRATRALTAPAKRPPASAEAPTGRDDARALSMLIVDDMPDNLDVLFNLFKGEYRVKLAKDAQTALKICHSDAPPDLLLLDVMMPDMDGFELAQQLRQHTTTERIPIIFVTAATDSARRAKGMSLGAVDYITKPIDPVAIKVRVGNFMRQVRLLKHLQCEYDQMLANEQRLQTQRQLRQAALQDMLGVAQVWVRRVLSDKDLSPPQRACLLDTLNVQLATQVAIGWDDGLADLLDPSEAIDWLGVVRFAVTAVESTLQPRNITLNLDTTAVDSLAPSKNLMSVVGLMAVYALLTALVRRTRSQSSLSMTLHSVAPLVLSVTHPDLSDTPFDDPKGASLRESIALTLDLLSPLQVEMVHEPTEDGSLMTTVLRCRT